MWNNCHSVSILLSFEQFFPAFSGLFPPPPQNNIGWIGFQKTYRGCPQKTCAVWFHVLPRVALLLKQYHGWLYFVLFKLCFLFYLTISRVRLVFSSLSLSTLHVNYIIAVRVNTSCKLHYCGSPTHVYGIKTMKAIVCTQIG
jgi:hypothetical protein